jgi:alpha-L-rhamnosidase
VLDSEGNFYTDNYRRAMSKMEDTCRDGFQTHKPQHTFYGFRYIRVNEYPGEVKAENFKAITVHSDIRRTGWFDCSDAMLNRWFMNTIWSQKDNFLDIPTDCPQRNERLGWLGDIQAFIRAGSYHFDIQKFMTKWLRDVKLSQAHNGCVPDVVPDVFMEHGYGKAAWADAITICPWQLYETYADTAILQEMYEPMKKWVDYITQVTVEPYTWIGSDQLGDWLALDCPEGDYKGSSRDDLLASAYYAKSTQIVADTAELLGYQEDAANYRALYEKILAKFQDTYNDTFETQTECVLALHFGLCKDPQKAGDRLAELVKQWGYMTTGFMGAPWLLHALSATGHSDAAWDLMLRTEYPSWLYSVTKGATTIWEHLDSLKPDGSFWSPNMNSFNHYAFGAAAAWLYEWAAGIQPTAPGFTKVCIMPQATKQLRHLAVEMDTRAGKITSSWEHTENGCVYRITTPVETELILPGMKRSLTPGSYEFTI